MLPLFSRRASSKLEPVALMRLTEIKDADEVLADHKREDIILESKLDGWKIQVIQGDGDIHLFSRRGEDVTKNFPLIVKALSDLPKNTLIEGELVYWYKGKQDVTKVISLAGSSAEHSLEKAKELPGKIKLHLYDILWHKGENVTKKPFSERRKLLESAVKTSDNVVLTKQYPFSKWQEVMNEAVESGGEGIVLKLKDAEYHWKPKGENEPKPANVMWKYKGGKGKHDSDDYVVYGTKKSPTGKLLAQFGQYYKNKLYAISNIDNFSEEDEIEIQKRSDKGQFVIELGFQERTPKGLRHQKFLRFRDDKKPKDATMHEFHVKHIGEFEPVSLSRKAIFALAGVIPDPVELINVLEQSVGKISPKQTGATKIGFIGNIDVDKIFRIVSKLESNGRTDVVGDTGTSFGPTQMHGPYFLSRLSRMPNVETVTGISREELRKMSSAWIDILNKIKKTRIWKRIPVDQDFAKKQPQIKRLEKTYIRQPDKVIEKIGGKFVGKILDLDVLRNLGFDVNSGAFQRSLNKIYSEYITDNVAMSALAQAYLSSVVPLSFQKFKRQFNSTNIRKNKALSNLIEKASIGDFVNRINAVVKAIEKSGYNTTVPGAYNIYQLIMLSNASGVGRVQQFLLNRMPFQLGNLHYLQSSRLRNTLNKLKAAEPELGSVIDLLLAGIPPNKGKSGFPDEQEVLLTSSLIMKGDAISRTDAIKMLTADYTPIGTKEPSPEELAAEQSRRIMALIERWLNYETIGLHDLRHADLSLIRIDRSGKVPTLVLWTSGDIKRLARLLPKKIWGMPLILHHDEPKITSEFPVVEYKEEVTPTSAEDRMSIRLFSEYIHLLKKVRSELKQSRKQVPEDELRRTVFLHVAEQLGFSQEQLDKFVNEKPWLRFSRWSPPFSKRAMGRSGTLAFPGHFAEDIKSGKIEKTIRPADMPVEVNEVVMAITYSGSDICHIKILSKETMSLTRLEKAFGKHVARSLENKFGPNRRFIVIRFTRFDSNDADDGTLDEEKRGEVLIDKDIKLTRGQIYDHYAKPAVRKLIMSRIKGKPVIIYLGVGKDEKILKRNHEDKPIVISSDKENEEDNPNNYWYWIKRRMLSIHEVFGTKTDLGFVDLDLHGGYPIEKAKEYAKKLTSAIKEKYGVQSKIYQSGGTGLHVEFTLTEKVSIDKLRKELRELLDKLNEEFEGVTTGIVKGKGMRTDVSTLHNKGNLRVPSSLGESVGKVKKILSQKTDDDYSNNTWGSKERESGPFGDTGALTMPPYKSVAPEQIGAWTAWIAADNRKKLFAS